MNRFVGFISSFFTRKKKKTTAADPPSLYSSNESDFAKGLREKLLATTAKLPQHLNQTFEVLRRSDLFFEEANYETGREFENSVNVLLEEFGKKLEDKPISFEFAREVWVGLDNRADFILKFSDKEEKVFEMMLECKYSSKEEDGEYLDNFMDEAYAQLIRYQKAHDYKSHLLVGLVNFKLRSGIPYLIRGDVLIINLHAFSYLLFVLIEEMEKI